MHAGVYFVPAFGGLLAPHWRGDARGVIVGLTSYTNKAHIVRALLAAICWQVYFAAVPFVLMAGAHCCYHGLPCC